MNLHVQNIVVDVKTYGPNLWDNQLGLDSRSMYPWILHHSYKDCFLPWAGFLEYTIWKKDKRWKLVYGWVGSVYENDRVKMDSGCKKVTFKVTLKNSKGKNLLMDEISSSV